MALRLLAAPRRFDLHDDLVFHHQTGPASGIDADAVIDSRNRLLAYRVETPAAQFVRQDCLMNGFQQAWAESRMNAESGADDLLREPLHGQHPITPKFREKRLNFWRGSLRLWRLCVISPRC